MSSAWTSAYTREPMKNENKRTDKETKKLEELKALKALKEM